MSPRYVTASRFMVLEPIRASNPSWRLDSTQRGRYLKEKNNRADLLGVAVDLIRIYSKEIAQYLFSSLSNTDDGREGLNYDTCSPTVSPFKLDSARGRPEFADDEFYLAGSVVRFLSILNTSDAREFILGSGLFSQLANDLRICLSCANVPISTVIDEILTQVPTPVFAKSELDWPIGSDGYTFIVNVEWGITILPRISFRDRHSFDCFHSRYSWFRKLCLCNHMRHVS